MANTLGVACALLHTGHSWILNCPALDHDCRRRIYGPMQLQNKLRRMPTTENQISWDLPSGPLLTLTVSQPNIWAPSNHCLTCQRQCERIFGILHAPSELLRGAVQDLGPLISYLQTHIRTGRGMAPWHTTLRRPGPRLDSAARRTCSTGGTGGRCDMSRCLSVAFRCLRRRAVAPKASSMAQSRTEASSPEVHLPLLIRSQLAFSSSARKKGRNRRSPAG